MRHCHRIVALACATVAFAVPIASANAVEPIEIVNEKTAMHCWKPCKTHWSGTVDFWAHSPVFGAVLEAKCDIEFEATIDEFGLVSVNDADVSANEAGTEFSCVSGGVTFCSLPWQLLAEEVDTKKIAGALDICVNLTEWSKCEGMISVDITEGDLETLRLEFSDDTFGSESETCSIDGGLDPETAMPEHAFLHINHLD